MNTERPDESVEGNAESDQPASGLIAAGESDESTVDLEPSVGAPTDEPASPCPRPAYEPPQLVLSRRGLIGNIVVFLIFLVGVYWYFCHPTLAHNSLRYLPPDRLKGLIAEQSGHETVYRIALLSFPLTMFTLLYRWRSVNPFAEIGLRARQCLWVVVGGVAGVLARVLVTSIAARIGGPAAEMAYYDWLKLSIAFSLIFTRGELALIALAACFALGSLIIPLGHLWAPARRLAPASRVVVLAAVLFVAPLCGNPFQTPLSLLNYLLLGLILAVYRERTGTAWRSMGLVAGWCAAAYWDTLTLTAPTLAPSLQQSLPPILSGGEMGLDGSLITTGLWLAWLTWVLRPTWRRRKAANAE